MEHIHRKRLTTLIGVLAVSAGWLAAQGDLATDRPSESAAATLIPAGIGRAELGGLLNWFTEANGEPGFSYAVPIGTVRYGLSEDWELRVGAQFAQQLGALQGAMVGAKYRLPGSFWGGLDACWLVELPINPAQGLTLSGNLPMAHRLCIGSPVGQRGGLTGNAGWALDGGASTWMASLALSRELGVQGWTGFIEPFVYTDRPVHLNFGVQRTVQGDWMIDFVYGRNLATGEVQVGLGASFTLVGSPGE